MNEEEQQKGGLFSSGLSLASSFISKKAKLIITLIISIVILIILFIFLIFASLIFLSTSDDLDEAEESIVEESGSMQVGEVTIIEKDGLSFLSPNSHLCYPITNMTGTTAKFGSSGTRWAVGHTGLDFVGPVGKAQAVSVYQGTVFSVSGSGSYGNHVIVKHQITGTNGKQTPVFYTMYCHLANINVYAGQELAQGQVIGMMGSTGNSSGPHCHFEFSLDPQMWKTSKDPMIWIFEEHILKDYGVNL